MSESELRHLLDQYREAVRATASAEDHGTHGDGEPARRRADELACRRQLLAYIRSH